MKGLTITVATGFLDRLCGLLFKDSGDAALLISPCRSIHTIGMKYPIDVAFVNREGIVVRSERRVGRRWLVADRRASLVLERRAGASPWFEVGERISIEGSAR